jgi:hypothetical protein
VVQVRSGTGSGGYYLSVADACPYVAWTASVKPTQNFTGTVNLTASYSGNVPVTGVNFYVDGTLIGTQTVATGKVPTYTQSWVTSGVAHGAHTLTVSATGNGCNTPNQPYNSFTIPITTSFLLERGVVPSAANDNGPIWMEKAAWS